jgi:hypothetical protein
MRADMNTASIRISFEVAQYIVNILYQTRGEIALLNCATVLELCYDSHECHLEYVIGWIPSAEVVPEEVQEIDVLGQKIYASSRVIKSLQGAELVLETVHSRDVLRARQLPKQGT